MAAVTIQADRGVSLQGQLARGRGGIQNGTFNRKVALSNTVGNANGELFIDGDGVSRLRFPPSTSLTMRGTLYTLTGTTQSAQAVFDYTFITSASGVTVITANVAAVGFTVTKVNVPNNQGGTEDTVIVTLSAPGANIRGYLDAQILDQSQVSPIGLTRQLAPAATVQAGRY